MTDFAAEADYAHDILADHFDAVFPVVAPDRPSAHRLTTVRGAALWGLLLARAERRTDEYPALAQATFRHAGLSCAGIAAAMVLYGHSAVAETWARAYRHLTDLADRADRARVSRVGSAT